MIRKAVKEHHADHMWVLEKNTNAIRFYERNGFVFSGEKQLEEGTAEYLLLFRKSIGTSE